MRQLKSVLIILVMQMLFSFGCCNNILFLAPVGTKSHKNTFMSLIENLVKKGHTVTHVTHTKAKNLPDGVTEVVIDEISSILNSFTQGKQVGEDHTSTFGMIAMFSSMSKFLEKSCDLLLNNKFIKDLLSGKVEKPDVIITSMIMNECSLAVVHKLGRPLIFMSPGGVLPWITHNLRYPDCPIYCPSLLTSYTNRMSFSERVSNLLTGSLINLARYFAFIRSVEGVIHEHFGSDVPPVAEIERNYSLILQYNHFSYDYPRLLLPAVIEVGGMHVKESKPLPQDLEAFVSGSGDAGVVYFSLGSVFKSSTMSEERSKIFVEAFSRIPQRVLWKWEGDKIPGLTPNVRTSKWFPQQDILGHPKVRLFITHGGLLSTMETTHHGVPVVGLPIAADQQVNMRKSETMGLGVMITWDELTVDSLVNAINTVISDPKYKERVSTQAKVARDRDMSPGDKGVYWVEYVMRHGGAYHLQPGSLHLNNIEYYAIDIYVFFHVILAIFIAIIVVIFKFIKRKLSKKAKKHKTKKQ